MCDVTQVEKSLCESLWSEGEGKLRLKLVKGELLVYQSFIPGISAP